MALLAALGPIAATDAAYAGSGDKVAFRPRATYRTGPGPGSLVIADVSRDGKLDLVVTNYTDGSVSVLYGRGDGYFLTRTDYPTMCCGQNLGTAVVDADLNGKLDILVARFADYSSSVGFLAGNGGGTFRAPKFSGQAPLNTSMAVGDFNRDGKIDVIFSSIEYGFAILFGDGRGGFKEDRGGLGPPQQAGCGVGGFGSSVFVGDVNRDEIPDLLTVTYTETATLNICPGNGDGTFKFTQSIPFGSESFSDVHIADINFDAKPDLISVPGNGNFVVVRQGRGDGTFLAPHAFSTGRLPLRLWSPT